MDDLREEAHLPQEASVDLPHVHVSAEYIQDEEIGADQGKGEDHLTTCSFLTHVVNHVTFLKAPRRRLRRITSTAEIYPRAGLNEDSTVPSSAGEVTLTRRQKSGNWTIV